MRAQINDSLGYNILTSLIPILASNETMQKAIVIFLFIFELLILARIILSFTNHDFKFGKNSPTDTLDNDITDSLKN